MRGRWSTRDQRVWLVVDSLVYVIGKQFVVVVVVNVVVEGEVEFVEDRVGVSDGRADLTSVRSADPVYESPVRRPVLRVRAWSPLVLDLRRRLRLRLRLRLAAVVVEEVLLLLTQMLVPAIKRGLVV